MRIEYYQEIVFHNFYRGGNHVRIEKDIRMTMTSLTDLGMEAVTEYEFEEGDILLFDIKIDRIPFDKLMGKVQQVSQHGYMRKMRIKFVGMPNALYGSIKSLFEVEQGTKTNLS